MGRSRSNPLALLASLAFSLSACHAPAPEAPATPPAAEPHEAREAAPSVPGGADVVAFVGVHVVPMDSERVLPEQTVLTRGDRIIALGSAASVEVPAEATVIDGRGKYLLPGLVDMHVHILSPEAPALFVANGVTSVRNMWGLPTHLKLREQIAAGEAVGPTIYTAGPIIDGEPVYWPGSELLTDPAEADALVAAHLAAGYDSIKVYMNVSVDAYRALVKAAHRHGVRIAGHVPSAVGMEVVLAHQVDSLEHLWGYFLEPSEEFVSEDRTIILRAEAESWLPATPAEMRALADELARKQVASCPTLIMRRNLSRLDAPEEAGASVHWRYVSPQIKHIWQSVSPFSYLDQGDFEDLRAGYPKQLLMTRMLRDAGARILLGTDTPNPYIEFGFAIHEELALLVEAGLSPYEALRAGTHDAADYLGALEEFGTVAIERRADLLLVEGNPLADVGNVKALAGVMVRGTWYAAEELQRMLDGVERDVAAALPSSGGVGVSAE